MKTAVDYFHQGDLNFRKVGSVPEGAKDITLSLNDNERGGLCLALGEASGHAHVLVKEKESSIKIMEQNGRRYLVIEGKPVMLLHGTFVAPQKIKEVEADRHEGLIIHAGIYEQGFELGYDPFLRMKKKVVD